MGGVNAPLPPPLRLSYPLNAVFTHYLTPPIPVSDSFGHVSILGTTMSSAAKEKKYH